MLKVLNKLGEQIIAINDENGEVKFLKEEVKEQKADKTTEETSAEEAKEKDEE